MNLIRDDFFIKTSLEQQDLKSGILLDEKRL